ncbi:MAG: hypothetical protein K6C95_06830 [Lachnospiraceae bacterium]|nr:hypothetical protein [Lachnospiraceae bacterium]
MPNQIQITSQYSDNMKKILNTTMGDDANDFIYRAQVFIGDEGRALIVNGHEGPGMVYQSDRSEYIEQQPHQPCAINQPLRMAVYEGDIDTQKMWEDFPNVVREAEEMFRQKVAPGDENIVDFANAMAFNPAKRAINGWPVFKLTERLNLNCWFKEFGAYTNGGTGDKARKELAYCDAHYPFNRMIIAIDKAIGIHVDYFDASEKKSLTPEQEADFRQRLLEEETRILQNLKVVSGFTDDEEGNHVQKLSGVGNPAHEFNRHSARGIKVVYSDTEARITGLQNGWPIEDLNALSSFKKDMDSIYSSVFYESGMVPKLREVPEYKPGEKEYLEKLQKQWDKIEKTIVRDPETRKALLTEMRDLIKEGAEKGLIFSTNLEEDATERFSHTLHDIERKLERELTPSEQEVMEHGEAYNKEEYRRFVEAENDAAKKRREEYDLRMEAERRERELRERAEEERAFTEQLAAEEQALRDFMDAPDYYEGIKEEARRRREAPISLGERERIKLSTNDAEYTWFYRLLADKRLEAAAAAPINKNESPVSDQNDITRYYMGKLDISYDEALNLKLLPPEDRRKLAEDYYDDLIAHPFSGVSDDAASKNARYFGELDAIAAKKMMDVTMPVIDLKDPEQVKNFATGHMGYLSTFAADFLQNNANLTDVKTPSSPVRQAYIGAFGGRSEYAAVAGKLAAANSLEEISRIVNDESRPMLQRAIGLHFLQKYYGELSGKKLSEIPEGKWLEIGAAARTVDSAISAGTDLGLPAAEAPTEEQLNQFMRGGESPFTDYYLKAVEDEMNRSMRTGTGRVHEDAVNNLRTGVIDSARIYNLDFIRQNGHTGPFGPEGFMKMGADEREKTARIFDQTLGNLISVEGNQPLLAAANGESVYDRFTIGGKKTTDRLKEIYGDQYERMTQAERDLAAEAELLSAWADPQGHVVFRPLNYDNNGNIVTLDGFMLSTPAPQRVSDVPANADERRQAHERALVRAQNNAQKLNSLAPGQYQVFGENYLRNRLEGAPQAQHEGIRNDFMLQYVNSTSDLADKVRDQSPDMAAYLRLQSGIARRALDPASPAFTPSYEALMNLVDQVHLPMPDAVDERQPGPVFGTLADNPGNFNAFPLMDAAESAERIMNLTADNAAPGDILKEIATLETHLSEMERVARVRGRGDRLDQAFDGDHTATGFINGNPGINTLRAELDGRRKAIIQGWPLEDTNLIAGLYAKRETVRRAMAGLPEGSQSRLAHERAFRTLNEICTTLDTTVIENAEQRKQVLSAIDAYGPALYNDITAGIGSGTDPQAFRNSVRSAVNADVRENAFRSPEDGIALADTSVQAVDDARKRARTKEEYRRERVRNARAAAREQRAREEQRVREEQRAREEQKEPEIRAEDLFDEIDGDEQDELIDNVLDDAKADVPDEELVDVFENGNADDNGDAGKQDVNADQPEQSFADFVKSVDLGVMPFEDDTFEEAFATEEERVRIESEREETVLGNLFDLPKDYKEAGYNIYGSGRNEGFFEWQDIRERLDNFAKGPGSMLAVKIHRLGSVTNDFRAYIMSDYDLSLEEVMQLSAGDLPARRQLASDYLGVLEAHPLNKNMTQEEREESARFYGEMHKKAIDKFVDTTFPPLDLSNRETIAAIGNGPSAIWSMGQFALDMSQDTEAIYWGEDPAVRSAYADAMGGMGNMSKLHDQMSTMQTVIQLARVVAEKPNPGSPLINKAIGKFYLESANAIMAGKKLSEAPEGFPLYFSNIGGLLSSIPVLLPAEGAPTEQELQDYLDGKIPMPFSDAYLEAANRALAEETMASLSETAQKSVSGDLASKLVNASAIYDLPYIPAGPEADRPRPDYLTMSEQLLHDTHVTFNRVFGKTLQAESNGQIMLSGLRGEEIYDRFLIDGKPVSQAPTLADAKNIRTPEEYRILLEAEIMQAMADPKRTVTYTPLTYDLDGKAVEMTRNGQPVRTEIARPGMPFTKEKFEPIPVANTTREAETVMKYTMARHKLPMDLTTVAGMHNNNPLLDHLKQSQLLIFGTDERLYSLDEQLEGEMEYPNNDMHYVDYNHIKSAVYQYSLIHGLMSDGTLTELGQNNLRSITDDLNNQYDGLREIAGSWNSRNPLLGEMIRLVADDATTYERGTPWMDLKKNYTYQNLQTQAGMLHLSEASESFPYGGDETAMVYQGYPTGSPRFPLPYAIIAGRRMALTEAAQNRSQENGTLTRLQDRLNRRMMLSEIEEIKKQLNKVDAMHLASVDEKGRPDPSKPGFMDVAHLNRYLENPVIEASSYYPRGTRHVHSDLNAKHTLICNGWPVSDLNLLSKLYIQRADLKEMLDKPDEQRIYILTPEMEAECARGYKVLCEITDYLDKQTIRNAADRERVLAHINSYGDLLYNDTVLGSEGREHAYRTQFEQMRRRQVPEMEFLSEQELEDLREKNRSYMEMKDSTELTSSYNAPVSDEERSFINAEQISKLAEAQGQLENNGAVPADPNLQNALHQIQLFTAGVDRFYRNTDLSKPENAASRRQEFERLVDQAAEAENALSEAEYALTNGGEKKDFTPEEEKTLRQVRLAKDSAREMNNMYAGFIAFEAQRREDIMAEEQRVIDEARAEAEQREIDERHMVNTLDYMVTLDPEERDRLRQLLTAPLEGEERFDFETGEIVEAQPRPLPDRILLAYDDDGDMRPQVLIMAEKHAALRAEEEKLAEENRQESIRAERRRMKESREAAAKAGISPYDEGAEDLFAEVDENSYLGEVVRQGMVQAQLNRTWNPMVDDRPVPKRREREMEGIRRRQAAIDNNDPRYEWSFSHILNDAWNKNVAAKQEKLAAAGEEVIDEARIAKAQFAATDAENIYKSMAGVITAHYSADDMDRVIEEKYPDYYKNTWVPMIAIRMQENGYDPRQNPQGAKAVRDEFLMSELITIPDRHQILSYLADDLPTPLREDVRKRMLTTDIPSERPYEEQISKPLHDRIQELMDIEKPVNADGVPVPPGEGIEEYREALEYADEVLDEVEDDVYRSATGRAADRAYVERTVRDNQFKNALKDRNDEYKIVAGKLLRAEEDVVRKGVLPVHETALNRILYPDMNYSQEYLNNIGHMLRRMDEMKLTPTQDGEQQFKVYAYEDVARAKADLEDAIKGGDWDKIIEAKRVYKEKRENMKELMDFAREHFSDTSTVGNLDSTRNKAVPWEYSKDYFASSHVNSIFQLYSAIKQTGVSVEDFIYDPYDARRQMNAILDEKRSYKTTLGNKSIGAGLGTLMAENDIAKTIRTIDAGTQDMMVSRAFATIVECNPNKENQAQNRLSDWLLSNHRSITSKVREADRNPFSMGDPKRATEVLQLLSVVSEEDLKENYDQMVCGVCYDDEGKAIPKITAEQYIAGKESFDYYELLDRGSDIIRDATAVEGTTFAPAAFMEERQKVLAMVLTSRAADAGTPGYDLLEYEVTHMAEVYDMLRTANPQMNLPELAQEQKQRMAAVSAQYQQKTRQLQNAMPGEQRNEIRNRRRANGDVADNARRRIVGREANRNHAEQVRRVREERERRREEAIREQEENRRLAQEQLKTELAAQAAREKTNREVEARIAEHADLQLTRRVLELVDADEQANREKHEVAARQGATQKEIRDTTLKSLNAAERRTYVVRSILSAYNQDPANGRLTKDQIREILTAEVGAERARDISEKLPLGVVKSLAHMEQLTEDEKKIVLGAIIGTLSPEQRERILADEKNFLPFEKMELSGNPYAPGAGDKLMVFESQLVTNSPISREIKDLKADIYNNWEKYSKGNLGKKERAQFAADLDYAEKMLRPVKESVMDFGIACRAVNDTYLTRRDRETSNELAGREENSFTQNLLAPKPGDRQSIEYPRAERTDDIRRLKNEKLQFDPNYIKTVANLLRKMENMGIIDPQAAAEEDYKIYSFKPLVKAQLDLKEAIKSKDREKIHNATEKLKEVRKEYDEMMRIAETSFHPTDYMDNLDVMRNELVPWDYAKNYVATSQLNAIGMFGNTLKDFNISVDDFERDPAAAIQEMERQTQERYCTMKGFAANKSVGALATNAQAKLIDWGVSGIGTAADGRYLRAVEGIIMADPGVSKDVRERNIFLHKQVTDYNSAVNSARQSRTLAPLEDGFVNESSKGREAVRALMVVDLHDIDPDWMFTDPPIAPDGTLMKPFSLSEYITGKQPFDYQAQASRTDTMIKDAARENARLAEIRAEDRRRGRKTITMEGYDPDGYSPAKLLKARQEALTELLVLRAHEKDQPGYQALVQELKEMPEHYERLRQSDPSLDLPPLTKAQKNDLKAGAKVFDELVTNRAKSMDAEEKRIKRAESAKEKAFTNSLKDINKTIRQQNQRLARLGQRHAPQREIDEALRELQLSERRRESLIRARARTIADDYKAGKIPEGYAAGRLNQLAAMSENNYQPVEAPPLFGERQTNPVRENNRLRAREKYLVQSLMEGRGYKVGLEKTDIADSMRNSMEKLTVPVADEWEIISRPEAGQAQPVVQNGELARGAQDVARGAQDVAQAALNMAHEVRDMINNGQLPNAAQGLANEAQDLARGAQNVVQGAEDLARGAEDLARGPVENVQVARAAGDLAREGGQGVNEARPEEGIQNAGEGMQQGDGLHHGDAQNPNVENYVNVNEQKPNVEEPQVHEPEVNVNEQKQPKEVYDGNKDYEEAAKEAGMNINEFVGQGSAFDLELEEGPEIAQNGPQQEQIKQPEVNKPQEQIKQPEQNRPQPKAPERREPAQRPRANSINVVRGVQEKSFDELEKKLLGGRPQEGHFQRKDAQAGNLKGAQLDNNHPDGPQKNGMK